MNSKKMLGILLMISVMINVTFVIGTNLSKVPKDNKNFITSGALAMYVEGENGEYSQSNESTFPKEGYTLNIGKSTCRNGGSLSQNASTKTINLSVGTIETCTLYFDKEAAASSDNTLKKLGVTSKGVRTEFDDPATTDEGVFEMEDDYGMSYYYRGAVENNYVKFAGFYWRIIRINGDGSLRIMYDGTQAHANGTSNAGRFINTSTVFNGTKTDAKYVGWMYGPAGTTASTSKAQAQSNIEDSIIKGVVDAWYKTNIEDAGYGNSVSDTLFCNDRTTPGKAETGYNSDTGLGYGTNATAYGAFGRFMIGLSARTGIQPTFKCPERNDAFTVNDTSKGNGALTYPVGLITADEVVAAGSGKKETTNTNYYLYRGGSYYYYWSLSPYGFGSSFPGIFFVSTNGSLNYYNNEYGGAVAPVINLSSEYVKTLRGTGTMTDPFQA